MTLSTNTPHRGWDLNETYSQQVNLSGSLENTRPFWTSGSNSTHCTNHPPPLEWIYAPEKEIWIWPLVKQNTELIEAGEEAKKMQGMHFTFQREPGICSTSSSCQLQNSSDLAEAPWPDVTLIWFSWLRLLLWNEQQSRVRMALPGAPCTRNRRRKSSPVPQTWHCSSPFWQIHSPHQAESGRWKQSQEPKGFVWQLPLAGWWIQHKSSPGA